MGCVFDETSCEGFGGYECNHSTAEGSGRYCEYNAQKIRKSIKSAVVEGDISVIMVRRMPDGNTKHETFGEQGADTYAIANQMCADYEIKYMNG